MHRMMISWSKCRPLKRSCAEVGSVIPAVIARYRAFQQFAPEPLGSGLQGTKRSSHRHTLGWVRSNAQMIRRWRRSIGLAGHYRYSSSRKGCKLDSRAAVRTNPLDATGDNPGAAGRSFHSHTFVLQGSSLQYRSPHAWEGRYNARLRRFCLQYTNHCTCCSSGSSREGYRRRCSNLCLQGSRCYCNIR
jgi:hypothetical protein